MLRHVVASSALFLLAGAWCLPAAQAQEFVPDQLAGAKVSIAIEPGLAHAELFIAAFGPEASVTRGRLVIKRAGMTVLSHAVEPSLVIMNPPDETDIRTLGLLAADYLPLSCAPGRGGKYYVTIALTDDAGRTVTDSNSFTVGRCTPFRYEAINGGVATSLAIRETRDSYPQESILRARCARLTATTWSCEIVRANNLRACADRFRVRRRSRLRFGRFLRERVATTASTRCASF